jgi:hypothetical protein
MLPSLSSSTCKATPGARGSLFDASETGLCLYPLGRAWQSASLAEPGRLRRERTWLGRCWLGPRTARV